MRTLFLLFLCSSVFAATTSRKAAVTCDFRPVALESSGYGALGKLEFWIDLDKKDVTVTCRSRECVLDGKTREIKLIANLDREMGNDDVSFANPSESDMPSLVLFGGNGDDTRFLVHTNYEYLATLTLMVTGNLTQSTKPVRCKVTLR